MDKHLRKLEREVDAGLSALAEALDRPPLRLEALARIRAAVQDEALRTAPQRRSARQTAAWGWSAAAAAIALVMAWPAGGPASKSPSVLDGPASLSEWLAAAGESGDQITMLLEGDWNPDGGRDTDGRHDSLDEALDSLEDSMSAVEAVFGA